MVDGHLLSIENDPRELKVLFLDINSCFASVEQNENPELQNKPIAVCPVMADTSFVIAASYEAKAFGVKTGTRIGDAKRMCPGIALVPATPALYMHYHKWILRTVEGVLPIDKVCSIDEMQFRLLGEERIAENARSIALRIKQKINDEIGPAIKCSVGIAPNSFLAKIGTELQKPDGLVVLEKKDLPNALFPLGLTDIPGINRGMRKRLQAHGIFSVEQLTTAPRSKLQEAFESKTGTAWWYLLQGFELQTKESERKTLSHSHVLPPKIRTEEGSRQVMLRLMQKAASRMRQEGVSATGMQIWVRGIKQNWKAHVRMDATNDTIRLTEYALELWAKRDFDKAFTVGVVFYDLAARVETTPSLFDPQNNTAAMSHVLDKINGKYGKNSIYLAGLEKAKSTASEKIAFQKTDLFVEGKDDHKWPDTWRGHPDLLPAALESRLVREIDDDWGEDWPEEV